MFAIRKYSHVILRRLYSTNLVETSSSDIVQKPTNDYALWATSETNRLIDYLSTRIKTAGPITVAEFMREALLNPKYVCYESYNCFYMYQKLFIGF